MSWTYLGRWDEHEWTDADVNWFQSTCITFSIDRFQLIHKFNWFRLEFNGFEVFCCNNLFSACWKCAKFWRSLASCLLGWKNTSANCYPSHCQLKLRILSHESIHSRRFGLGCPGCLPRTPWGLALTCGIVSLCQVSQLGRLRKLLLKLKRPQREGVWHLNCGVPWYPILQHQLVLIISYRVIVQSAYSTSCAYAPLLDRHCAAEDQKREKKCDL